MYRTAGQRDEFRQRLEAVRSADSDNKGWITAQLEVDYQGLLLTVEHTPRTADETEKYLSAVRREFDVYYSRIDILETAMRRLNPFERVQSQTCPAGGLSMKWPHRSTR
ncbi:MAG: hypothetical protein R3D81_14565 [Thalassovita sp.]